METLDAVPVFQWIGQDETGNSWWQLVGMLDLDTDEQENNNDGTDVRNDGNTGNGGTRS